MGYMYIHVYMYYQYIPGDSALVAYMYMYVQYIQITKHFIHACVVHRKQCVQSDAMNFWVHSMCKTLLLRSHNLTSWLVQCTRTMYGLTKALLWNGLDMKLEVLIGDG